LTIAIKPKTRKEVNFGKLYVKQERKLASASQERKLASASPEKEVNFGKLKRYTLAVIIINHKNTKNESPNSIR